MTSSSLALQICSVDSLHHALYHIGVFKFIYFINFGVFCCFYLEKYGLGKC